MEAEEVWRSALLSVTRKGTGRGGRGPTSHGIWWAAPWDQRDPSNQIGQEDRGLPAKTKWQELVLKNWWTGSEGEEKNKRSRKAEKRKKRNGRRGKGRGDKGSREDEVWEPLHYRSAALGHAEGKDLLKKESEDLDCALISSVQIK